MTGKQLFERMKTFTKGSLISKRNPYESISLADMEFIHNVSNGNEVVVRNARHIATKANSRLWVILDTKAWDGRFFIRIFEPISGVRGWTESCALWKVEVHI